MRMYARLSKSVKKYPGTFFLVGVLLFVHVYSFSTLTTKPAYWYDEALNVELSRNFSESGKLDVIIAPGIFSGKGGAVGSTGYPATVPLAGVFKLFGFGLAQARAYMLVWMCALLISFFFIAKRLWSPLVAYGGTLLIATFAPFYGNGRSVMGEIPGFLFFLFSFYFLERKRYALSGVLLGLAVVSKPSVFIFLIPAYTVAILCMSGAWKARIVSLVKLGGSSILALLPWFAIYVEEIAHGGLGENIFNHFKNPYAEAGASALSNVVSNLPSLLTSTTLLYIWCMIGVVVVALIARRSLLSEHKTILIIGAVYFPLALFQYLKSFGYLRYLIAFEFVTFIVFLLALPTLLEWVAQKSTRISFAPKALPFIIGALVLFQTVHLFFLSDLYASEKTERTVAYLAATYPNEIVGVHNLPQIGSMLPAARKYQYFRTYGLWDFGTRILSLPQEELPTVLLSESGESDFSPEEVEVLKQYYVPDMALQGGFAVYRLK